METAICRQHYCMNNRLIMYLLCSRAGFFMVTVTDPSYPDQPVFEYDIGANCPAEFKLDFNIPTRGPDTFDKHLRVQIHDTFRTIHMNVFRPAPNISQETLGKKMGRHRKKFQHRRQVLNSFLFTNFAVSIKTFLLKCFQKI